MIQVSRIQGHEIRIVSYALLDGSDCRFYWCRLRSLYTDAPPAPPISQYFISKWLVHRTRKDTRCCNYTNIDKNTDPVLPNSRAVQSRTRLLLNTPMHKSLVGSEEIFYSDIIYAGTNPSRSICLIAIFRRRSTERSKVSSGFLPAGIADPNSCPRVMVMTWAAAVFGVGRMV